MVASQRQELLDFLGVGMVDPPCPEVLPGWEALTDVQRIEAVIEAVIAPSLALAT